MTENPMLQKELLLLYRVRHQKPVRYAAATIGILILAMVYWTGLNMLDGKSGGGAAANNAFNAVMSLQFLYILVTAPTAAANAISREREQQTWEMLVSTRLEAREIILGKLAARLSPTALVLLAFLPYSLLMFDLSHAAGTSASDVIEAPKFFACYLVLAACALLFTVTGLWFSWKTKRTIYAILASYIFVIGFLCVGTVLITITASYLVSDNHIVSYFPVLWFNPVRLMYAPFMPEEPGNSVTLSGGLVGYTLISISMLGEMIHGLRKGRHGST